MQTRGTFPGLYSGQSRNQASSRLGTPSVDRSVSRAQSPNPILPPKRRRQLVQPQSKIASNPLGQLTANPNLAAMVGNALNVKRRGV